MDALNPQSMQIVFARDIVEPAIKPGNAALSGISLVAPLVRPPRLCVQAQPGLATGAAGCGACGAPAGSSPSAAPIPCMPCCLPASPPLQVRKLGPNANPAVLKTLPLASAAMWGFYFRCRTLLRTL